MCTLVFSTKKNLIIVSQSEYTCSIICIETIWVEYTVHVCTIIFSYVLFLRCFFFYFKVKKIKKYNHQKKTLKIESLFNSHGFALLSLTNFLSFNSIETRKIFFFVLYADFFYILNSCIKRSNDVLYLLNISMCKW